MKKRIVVLALTICLILPSVFVLSACNDNVTDVAYVQFVPAVDGEYVHYTSQMYSGKYSHVYLLNNAEKKDSLDWDFWEDEYLLKISFNRGFGIDKEIDDKETFVVELEGWTGMDIYIKKEYYDASKKVYLNGVDITSKADSTLSTPPKEVTNGLGTFWDDAHYYFEDFGLVKGNKNNYINTIEYK